MKQTKLNKKKQSKAGKADLWKYWPLAIILILTVVVYANSIDNDFAYQFDDDLYITNNPDIKDLSMDQIRLVFTKSYVGLYLPLTMLSYMIEYSMFGLDPSGYHITNLLLHLACIVLVFLLIYKIKPNIYLASVVAGVFALHPMHVESVSWISERKDVLYAVFYLGGLIAYLNYIGKPSAKNYLLALLLFVFSLLSKTVAVSFPLLLVAFDWYKGRPLWSRKVILEKLPFFALSLVFGLVGIYFTSTGNDTSTPDIAWIHRPFIVATAMMIYLYKFIAPFDLMNYYYYPDTSAGSLPGHFYWLSAILVLIIVAALIWIIKSKKHQRDLLLGWAFFIIPTFFILQIIPAGRAFAAERYTYLSYIGLAWIFGIVTMDKIADASVKNTSLRATLIAIVIFFVLGFSFLSWERNKDWQDSMTLFGDLVRKNPDHGHPYLIRGITHVQFGRHQAALDDYNQSIALDSTSAKAWGNRSSVRGILGDYQGALADANTALRLLPDDENALNNRATAYFFLQDFDNALADYNRLIAKKPWSADLLRKRIAVLSKANRTEDLLHDYLLLSKMEPTNHVNFAMAGEIYYHLDSTARAIEYLSQAMRLKPNYTEPLFLRGNAYFRLGDYTNAAADFERSARARNNADAYYNWGQSLRMQNQMEAACQAWQKAKDLGHADAQKRLSELCR